MEYVIIFGIVGTVIGKVLEYIQHRRDQNIYKLEPGKDQRRWKH